MISDVTTHIADQLNEFLVRKYDLEEKIVVIADGSDEDVIANKIAMTLVNLSLDPHPQLANRPATPDALVARPPLLLNFYILVSANFSGSNYLESLKFVSDIVNFFWERPVFDKFNSPNLSGEVDKVTVDIEDISIKDMHSIFSAAGRTFLPSVLYRVRVFHGADH